MILRTDRELIEALKRIDEITLLEALGLTSEDILERFTDRVATKRKVLKELIDENDYDVFDDDDSEYEDNEEMRYDDDDDE